MILQPDQYGGLGTLFLSGNFFSNSLILFKKWFAVARKSEVNDSNASSLATSSSDGIPSVRMVLLKSLSDEGFVFYTNFNSKKGNDLNSNPNASMCFYWKSIRRQIRVSGKISVVDKKEADEYFSSRDYGSKISAWASSQSKTMKHRSELLGKIKEFEKKFSDKNNVPRPSHWSGWRIIPNEIEFWLEIKNRSHERLNYKKSGDKWIREVLYP